MLDLFVAAGYMLIIGAILFVGVAILKLAKAVTNNKKAQKTHRSSVGAVLVWLGGATLFVAAVAFASIIVMGLDTVSTDSYGKYTDTIPSFWPVAVGGGVGGALMLLLGAVLCKSGDRAK